MKSFTEPPTAVSVRSKSAGLFLLDDIRWTLSLVRVSISASSKWEIANPKHLSGISGIDFFDILADGVADMIVAREDGTIEVYNFETAEEPLLKYTYVSWSLRFASKRPIE